MDSAFVKAYISFVSMLVSARPEYLTLVLERAAQSLTYREHSIIIRRIWKRLMRLLSDSARKALDAGFVESSLAPLTRRIVYDRVHTLVAQLLELFPTLPSTLYPLLVRHFPHKRQREAELVTYIRNLLRLSDYCPDLWDRILGLIVDRALQIDVSVFNYVSAYLCLHQRRLKFKSNLRNLRRKEQGRMQMRYSIWTCLTL